MTITVDIPASFRHASAIYDPWKPVSGQPSRFGIMLPALPEFAGCNVRTHNGRGDPFAEPVVNASSQRPPIIMVGDGKYRDGAAWEVLCSKAMRYRVPLDTLLIDRPLKVACDLWTPNQDTMFGKPIGVPKQAINLIGVQILGDFTKSPLLDERIAEIKAWFSEGDDE